MPIEILAHRGFWKTKAEQNTETAFRRALELGCGIETDIRDTNETLVISHDMAPISAMPLSHFFDIYSEYSARSALALNIKSNELQSPLKAAIDRRGIQNYFCFDMSVPDAWKCIKAKLAIYTRISEFEKVPSLYEESAGIWFDVFLSDWISASTLVPHAAENKILAIVSPELHGRPHIPVWEAYRSFLRTNTSAKIQLCTDYVDQALTFFADD